VRKSSRTAWYGDGRGRNRCWSTSQTNSNNRRKHLPHPPRQKRPPQT